MRWNSVRLRLTAWNIGVLALVLVLFGGVVRYTVRANLISGLDQAISGRSHGAADYIASTDGPGFPAN